MSGDITVSVENVTPVMATELLKASRGNFRPIDRSRVMKYATEMTHGKWDFNGETIKLNGNMIVDGQHRLSAIARSGVTIKCIVIRNLDQSAGRTIDSGKPRRVSDWVRFKGKKNARSITAIARNVMSHKHGRWGCQSVMAGLITDSEIIDYIEANGEILQDAHIMANNNKILVESILGAVMVIAADGFLPSTNPMCKWFCDAIKTGIGLSENDPVLLLRNKFADVTALRKESPFMQKMLLTVAWNKTAKGESVKILKFALTGPAASKPLNTIELAPYAQ